MLPLADPRYQAPRPADRPSTEYAGEPSARRSDPPRQSELDRQHSFNNSSLESRPNIVSAR